MNFGSQYYKGNFKLIMNFSETDRIRNLYYIYILVYPGYAKDELKNSDTWTAKIGVNTAENNNSIDNSSNYCH